MISTLFWIFEPVKRFFLLLCVFVSVFGIGTASSQAATLMLYGDSLMAGYGLKREDGFERQLSRYLEKHQQDLGIGEIPRVKIENASVSGDTSAAGLARLAWSLESKPDMILLTLGANDGLRGLPPAQMSENISQILRQLKARNIPVLLAGMKAPPNMGQEYADAYNPIFQKLAKVHNILFYPFFLEGVAAHPKYNQTDGMHPNPEGVAVIIEQIAPFVADLIKRHASDS